MNVSGTMNSATGHTSVSTRTGNFSDGLYDKAGARPDLDLDFARTKSLKDRISKEDLITFTRSTTASGSHTGATYVDEKGYINRAGSNLIKYSQDLSQSDWTKTNSTTFTGNNVVAPDGTLTAGTWSVNAVGYGINAGGTNDTIIDPSSTSTSSSAPLGGSFANVSFPSDGSWIRGRTYPFTVPSTANNSLVVFPLVGAGSIYQIVPVINGEDYVYSAWIKKDPSTGKIYTWGVQLEPASNYPTDSHTFTGTHPLSDKFHSEYVKTTTQPNSAPRFTHDPETLESKGLLIEQEATNLTTQSNTLQSLVRRDVNRQLNSSTAPDGTNTATRLIPTRLDDVYRHLLEYQYTTLTTSKTASVFVKADPNGNGRYVQFGFGALSGQAYHLSTFDTETGQVTDQQNTGTTGGGGFLEATPYPNGWYRLRVTSTDIGSNSNWVKVGLAMFPSLAATEAAHPGNAALHGSQKFIGDVAEHSILVWGLQVEAGELETSYIPTPATSTVTRSPDLASIEGDNFGTYRANMLNAVSTNLVLHNTGVTTTAVSVIENTTNMHVTAYSALAPDGTFSAVKMEDDDLGSTSAIRQISYRIGNVIATDKGNGPLLANTTYTVSGYFKAGTASKASFWLAGTDWATPLTPQQWINLSDGSLLGSTSVQTANNATVTDAGNGWYRLSLTCTTGSSSPLNNLKLRINSVIPTGTQHSLNFTGKSGSFYMWGLQIEEGTSVTPYIPSTDKYTNRQSNATFVDGNGIIRTSYANLVQYSEDFTNSEWDKDRTTVTGNQTIAPDGTNTADLLTATVGTTGNHRLRDTGNSLGPHQYTFSVFVKPNTTSHVGFQMYKTGIDTILFKRYKLDTEEVVEGTGAGTGKITKYPNGWYRIEGTTAPDTNTAITSFVIVLYQNDSTNISYTGAGESVYIWGAQVIKHTDAGDYYKTTGTVDGPSRYSHDPETLTPTGLYLEAKTTNDARDTERLGATGIGMDTSDVFVAGPYTFSHSKRKTETGITNPDGSTDGTCVLTVNSGTHNRQQPRGFRLPNVNSLSGRSVQSVFVKRKTSTARYVLLFMGGTGTYQQCLFDFDTETVVENTAPHNLADHQQYNAVDRMVERGVVKYPNGWYRLYLIVNAPNVIAGNGYGVGLAKDPAKSKSINQTDDGPYDGTEAIYVWGLNRCSADDVDSNSVRQETNLSSYIKNSQVNASEVTRTPDNFTSEATEVLDRANGTKPAFYTTDGISIYAEAKYNANSHANIANFSRILQLRKDTTNVVGLYKHDNQIQFIGPNDMFVQRGFNLGSGDLKIGTRYAKNDSRLYLNFNQSLTNTQGTLDTIVPAEEKATDLYIGNNAIGSGFTNGTIKRLTFWTTPLPDNKLDRITA